MPELAMRNIEHGAVVDLRPICVVRQKNEFRFGIDKLLDQPRTRHSIDFDLLASDPLHIRRSEEHTSELQSQSNLVCRLLLEHKNDIASQAACLISPTPRRSAPAAAPYPGPPASRSNRTLESGGCRQNLPSSSCGRRDVKCYP